MRKKTAGILFLYGVAVFITIIFTDRTTIYAQIQTPKIKTDTCITSECHAKITEQKFVHGPVAVSVCTACHGKSPKHKDSPKKFKFEKIKNLEKICYSCHDHFKLKKLIHKPVKEGDCTACHSPHGSPYKYQLLKQGSSLCFNCHDKKLVSGKYVHRPVDLSGCVICHDPHSADYGKNLKAKLPALCFMCHDKLAESFRKAKVIHKPVAESCTICHDPHSAPEQFMLSYESSALCFNCHKEKKKWVDSVSVQHGALVTGKACLNCHEAHVSNIAKNLSMPPLDLCMNCHDKELKTSDGRYITDMKKLLAEFKDHHGSIRQKDCSGCHNPHGSANFRILRNSYPNTFYISYSPEHYNLCFSCHEKSIVTNQKTSKLTDFRNGDINLHFLHVNKPEKGRTCRACHETHASNYPKHIREAVPFGAWELPVNYQKTETGGSCAPGCHKIKKYDRRKKIENP